MPSPPDKPPRPPRRFSALKPPRRARTADDAGSVLAERDDPVAIDVPPPAEAGRPVEVAPPEPASAAPVEPSSPLPALSQPRPEKASGTARVAKVMARAGLCSRRDAEGWITDGRVAVNGAVLTSPALDIGPADVVTVDGYPIDKPERTRLFLFNKARGLVTTARDPEGRPTVFDALPPELPRLVTVGRLDINTEGLLLLTNDGGLARLLELPSTGWIRRYRVRANGSVTQAALDALAKGVTVDGVAYGGIAAKLDRVQGANLWLTMGLKEGKNREIKRVLEHLGLAVTRLIRISFGPFQLGDLPDNAVEEVRTRVLKDQLGTSLARQAGVDLDGPAGEAPLAAARPPRESRPAVEPRRRTERAATADRRGRPVTVERITTPTAGPPGRSGPRRARGEPWADAGDRREPSSGGRPGRETGRRRDERSSREEGGASRVAFRGPGPRPTGRDRAEAGRREDQARPGSRSGSRGAADRSREPGGGGPARTAGGPRRFERAPRDPSGPGISPSPRGARDQPPARPGSRNPSGRTPPRPGGPGGGAKPRGGGGRGGTPGGGPRGGPGGGKGRAR